MNDKYSILQECTQNCQRLFGMKFKIFKIILERVQKSEEIYLPNNPISNRGLTSNFGLANQLLLTLEYLKQ